ncbi:lipocalin family protein [Aliarcobacter butzleri]|uniref:lipocalin family protein n=1 Tax=Aliarcobacter butzleri TaxID=28197 RepID=UPI00263E14AC|nr:lipocalin family protein [Aliarcobacter butzleri]MDN5041980.1 lipocalin family protein [Aliarcobacter butzleri]
MKFLFLTIFFSSSIFANTLVDIKKFSGLWYEIARIGNSFQTSCVASSVEYKLQENNTYDVYNRCFENELDGKLIEYNGFAKLENNQLFMRYFFVFKSSYKIEYLNDYKTAVVSNDDYSNLWIMSRTPNIDKNELEKILDDLENKMDISKLVFTKLDPKGRYK